MDYSLKTLRKPLKVYAKFPLCILQTEIVKKRYVNAYGLLKIHAQFPIERYLGDTEQNTQGFLFGFRLVS